MQIEKDVDSRQALKMKHREWKAPVFRATARITFYVRDPEGNWFEAIGKAWHPCDKPDD